MPASAQSWTGAKTGTEVAEALFVNMAERSRLVNYARTRFGIELADAEELVQETFLNLLRYPLMIQRPDALVNRIFHRRCCDFLRHRRERRDLVVDPGLGRENVDVFQDMKRRDRHTALRIGFRNISEFCRKILRAHYIEGLSLKETALRMTKAKSGVSKLISRCIARLRKCI